jgi:hypothetical protein
MMSSAHDAMAGRAMAGRAMGGGGDDPPGEDGRVDVQEVVALEVLVDALRERVPHAQHGPDGVGARSQVHDFPEELKGVSLEDAPQTHRRRDNAATVRSQDAHLTTWTTCRTFFWSGYEPASHCPIILTEVANNSTRCAA